MNSKAILQVIFKELLQRGLFIKVVDDNDGNVSYKISPELEREVFNE